MFVRTLLAGIRDTGVDENSLPDSPGPDGRIDVRSGWRLLRCVVHHQAAEFDASRQQGREARALFERSEARYGEVFTSLYMGMAAMAQGLVQEAAAAYGRARRVAKRHVDGDACLAGNCDVLLTELDVERNREKAFQQRPVPYPWARGSWFDVDAAALAIEAELRGGRPGGSSVDFLGEALERVEFAGITGMDRYLPALLCFHLAADGLVDRAEQSWRDYGLPHRVTELTDPEGRSWREMEVLSCARIRLLIETGAFDAAVDLAQRTCAAAAACGLMRTRLRGLSLALLAEELAGRRERAVDRLVEYLRAAQTAFYPRPLARIRRLVHPVLEELRATAGDPAIRKVADAMAPHVNPAASGAAVLSKREMTVLAALEGNLRNKEIARSMGVSEDGVRYHLKNLYRKLKARGRLDAVRCARAQGLLAAEGASDFAN